MNNHRHTFFVWAFLFALIALIIHGVARNVLEDSMRRGSALIEQVQTQHTVYTLDPQAVQSSHIYNRLTFIGVSLTVLSIVCMSVAGARHEKGWYLILTLVLMVDIIAPMLL